MPAKKIAKGAEDRLRVALEHLAEHDPLLHAAALPHHALLSERAARRTRLSSAQLFAKLAESITSQQLSVKAADTIWQRLEAACGGSVTPEAVKRLRTPSLRKAGLSAAKAKTLKGLAAAVIEGDLDLLALKRMPEEDAIAKLSSFWGVGRWTAEMFLMFALDREDVFSAGDLGLRRAVEALYGLPKDCSVRDLEAIAAKWSPHRTYASRALWRIRDASSQSAKSQDLRPRNH